MTEPLEEKIRKLREECENITETDAIEDESLTWEDAHLKNFITAKFPELNKTDELNVAYHFLNYLLIGRVSQDCNLRKLIVFTASFLRSPKNPTQRILESPVSTVSDENIPAVDGQQIFSRYFPDFRFRESLMKIGRNGIVSYASFLAVVLLRVTVKSPENVLYYIEKKSTAKFNEYFPGYALNGFSPKIPRRVTESLSQMNLKTHPVFINLFSLVLTTFKEKLYDQVVRQYLFDLILTHTCHHGLRLIRDYKTALEKLKADPEIFRKCLTNDKTKESLQLLKDFDRKYDNKENVLWPWARMLKDGYFSQFRSLKHIELSVILTALLEPFEGAGVWKSKFLTGLSGYEKAKARKFAKGVSEIIDGNKNRV